MTRDEALRLVVVYTECNSQRRTCRSCEYGISPHGMSIKCPIRGVDAMNKIEQALALLHNSNHGEIGRAVRGEEQCGETNDMICPVCGRALGGEENGTD